MFTSIKLDEIRNFRFGMKAIALIEKELDKSVSELDFDNMRMQDAAVIMWAGLVHEDKELTPDKVMELVDDHSDIKTAFEKMAEAFQEAFGADEDEKNAAGAAKKKASSK